MIFAILDQLTTELLAGIIIGSFGIVIAWLASQWRTMRSLRIWQKKEFKDRAVLALNTLQKEDGKYKLTLRSLFERDLRDVLQNDNMVKIVQEAIEKVTVQNPLLPLPKEDSWYVLNAILNKIAEQFAGGIIRRDMEMSIQSKRYVFCLTFEKEGGIRMQKVRIMIMQREHFENFPDEGEILLESEKHSTRVQTLRILKQQSKENPHLFMDIELYQ